jgi:hypothetical protein
MKLFIKNMVSIRSKNVVKSELDKMGLHFCSIELGQVELKDEITDEQWIQLNMVLLAKGLEVMDDKRPS